MNQISMIPVKSIEQIETLSKLACEIWNQHFVPIIGQAQVDYMLDKFLSPKAFHHGKRSASRIHSKEYGERLRSGIRIGQPFRS